MATKRTAQRLAAYERRYRHLARRLADIGFITSGSVASRLTRCGKTSCACHADPPKLHGPYWHWTAKVDGKTVNRRLNDDEARLYTEWIANDRRLRVSADRPSIRLWGWGTCRQTGCDRWPSRYSCHPRHAVSGAPRTVWHNMIQKSAIFQRNCL